MGRKHSLDKFYTKPEIAKLCISKLNLNNYNIILEPSAGNGSFSNFIPNVIAIDLDPENNSILKQDFFTFNKKVDLIIGNPPFGRQASLAFKFFKHASTLSNNIAFILPKSFKKESYINRLPIYFHLQFQMDLPNNSFILNNQNYNVPTVFQIWKKENYKRIIPEKETTNIFKFTTKNNANVAIRRVGVYAGKAFLDLNKSIQSHYFIITKNPKDFVNKVNNISWEHNNTTGPKSISKPELIRKINYEFSNYR